MALTVDEIAEMISAMRIENENNVENFEKALTNINSKLELMADDNEATDLLKVYLTELKNVVENRFKSTDKKLKTLENVVTETNFSDFRKDLADFVQKIIDNDTALNTELSYNTEKIEHILTNMNSADCKYTVVSDKLDELKNLYGEKSVENCESIISDINDLKSELVKADIKLNFDGLNVAIANVISEVNDIKSEMLQKHDNISEDVSTAFASVKLSLENIVAATNSFNDSVKNESNKSAETILANIDEIFGKVDELKENLNDLDAKNITSTEKISTGLFEFRENVDAMLKSLKDYIAELNAVASDEKLTLCNEISEKLSGMETAIVNSSELYEEKTTNLQVKLDEFTENIDKISSTTEEKFSNSIDEIESIKAEVLSIRDVLGDLKNIADEKSQKVLTFVDEELKTINSSFEELKEETSKELDLKLNESLDLIENRFAVVLEAIEKINAGSDFTTDFEEKFSALKQEIRLVNTDVTDIINSEKEQIIQAFEPIRVGLESFSDDGFNKVITNLKTVLETSFMNFSVDVNGELVANSEAVLKLEQAYKEMFNKISAIEECVADNLKSDIELLNVTIETNSKALQSVFEEKLDEYINDLKKQFSDFSTQNNVALAKISTLGDDLKNYVQLACENVLDKENKELLGSLENIVAKSDEINSNIEDKIKSNVDELKNDLDVISNKVDVLVSDDSFDVLYEKFDDFSETGDKLAEMISVLHQKVDAIAMDESSFDIEEEIDDIKELIFEQRKYFEASSDEKANAIDKYLKDVLLKLDSVDLEKNADDIKETIMNALVSLVDQISFVEETEEIKDFVEEKTDAINQSLIEVQNQLRQIASPDDDFAYSYTLQDVESDIAKLRLAISHLSGNDFEGLSDDIKKIVNSVEGLESTLTQDQMVDLKSDIEKLNEDILSISSRTNKLLLTSDESYKSLNDGLNNFTSLVSHLEDRINYLDNSEANERLEKKIENIQSMAEESANADKVFHQVMMYLGEWIDSSSESISSITEKIEKVEEKTSEIEQVKSSIEELRSVLPEKEELLSQLEEKFEQQESRIDRLEMKIEKILSILEEKDDMVLNRKVDKIEKMLSRLGTNIEKLTSYVDED